MPGAGGSKGHADMVGHLQDGIQMRVEGRSRCHCEFQTLSVSTQALSMDVGVLEAPGHVGPITSIHRVGAGRWKAAIRLTHLGSGAQALGTLPCQLLPEGSRPPSAAPPGWAPALLAAWPHSLSIRVGPGRGACTWLLPTGGPGPRAISPG